MKYLLTGVAAIAMLTACGQKDKPEDVASAPASALAVMALDTSGSGNVSWDKKQLNGDKAVFTDVTIAMPDDSTDSEEGLDLDGADLKAAKMEFDGLSLTDGKASFSRFLMSDVSIVPQDPGDAGEGSGTIGSIELVNPSPETAAWVAGLFADAESADLPEGAALAFDAFKVKDIDFRIHEEEGDQGTFTVKGIEVTGLKDQKAALMKLDNMAFDLTEAADDANMKVNFSSLEMRGADLKVLTGATEEAANPEDVAGMMNLTAQDPANPGYDSLQVDDFTMDMAGVKVALPKLSSAVEHDKENNAVAVRTDPFTVSLSTGEGKYGDQLSGQLAMLGYETVELSGAGYQTYEPDSDLTTYVDGQNYWELKDGFRVDFSMKYAGAKEMAAYEQGQALDADPAAAFGDALDKMVLHNFQLRIDDDGFIDRAFNAYAAQTGEDPQEARNMLSGYFAMAPMMAASLGLDPALVNEAAASLSSFVTDPKTLTIRLAPPEPMALSTIASMEDPSQITKESLGFEASNADPADAADGEDSPE